MADELDEVLLGAVAPRVAQVEPRADTSLKASAKEPLETSYLAPLKELRAELAL